MLQNNQGRVVADGILRKLLTRVERQPERTNKVAERMPDRAWLSEDRSELYGRLDAAEREGAVVLEWGKRENSHNIDRVILADRDRLYAFLGARSPAQIAETASREMAVLLPGLDGELVPVLGSVIEAWTRSRNVIRGVGPDDPETAAMTFRAAQALLKGGLEGMGYRTFSRRATGDSKFLESNQGRVADVIRAIREFPDHYDAENVIETFGLKKVPPACLVSGPLSFRGRALPASPYVGLPPEMVTEIGVLGAARWILLIENLESFNRQVREAAAPDAVIVFTGGFPSESTLEAILRVARATDCPVFHWGDIDSGGVKIAHRIDRALSSIGKRLRLHLMSPEVALAHGMPCAPEHIFRSAEPQSEEIGRLAEFLASSQARHLEQEELDPIQPTGAVA